MEKSLDFNAADEQTPSAEAKDTVDATSPEAIARSEENIRVWMSYLPQDCVELMIRMGWDLST